MKQFLMAKSWHISSKYRNRLQKLKNGNGRKSILVSHWNLGSRQWKKKVNAIQALVDTKKPDLIFISEANMYKVTQECETLISGYQIIKPLTV